MNKSFFLIEDEIGDICIHCGGPAIEKYCRKYSGLRGKCTACNVNWPLS